MAAIKVMTIPIMIMITVNASISVDHFEATSDILVSLSFYEKNIFKVKYM